MGQELKRLREDESGQSMVEAALMSAFVLLPLMGGVIYFGGMVLVQENLAVAARHVARSAALSSIEKALGTGGIATPATDSVRKTALGQAMNDTRSISVSKVNWAALGAKPIDGYTAQLTFTSAISCETLGGQRKSSHQMGIGVMYHGATVEKVYSEFAPVGKLAGLSSLTPTVSATSVMPTELPIGGSGRGGPKGLLNLNTWITEIVNEEAPPLEGP